MEQVSEIILSLESLEIGYFSGKKTHELMPPLTSVVNSGEVVSIIGQNGIGKSTLLRTIAGLHQSLGGDILIKGKSLSDYDRSDLARCIGYVSTEPVRVSSMRVIDLVRLGRYPCTGWTGKLGNEDHEAVADSMVKAGIIHLSDRFINELSDGERQRAMIARTLAQDADIVIMDEPTAFLDIRSRYEIIHLLHDLSVNRKKTIICSTHDLQTAIHESDRIWILFRDSFCDGAPEDLILDGAFQKLFDNSSIKFEPSDASFRYSHTWSGYVSLESDPGLKYWSTRALERAGFGISDGDVPVKVKALYENGANRWQLDLNGHTEWFVTLYDLVSRLTQRITK